MEKCCMWGDNTAIADTQYGKVQGLILRDIYTFRGIPYGADISGKHRFLWIGLDGALLCLMAACERFIPLISVSGFTIRTSCCLIPEVESGHEPRLIKCRPPCCNL